MRANKDALPNGIEVSAAVERRGGRGDEGRGRSSRADMMAFDSVSIHSNANQSTYKDKIVNVSCVPQSGTQADSGRLKMGKDGDCCTQPRHGILISCLHLIAPIS